MKHQNLHSRYKNLTCTIKTSSLELHQISNFLLSPLAFSVMPTALICNRSNIRANQFNLSKLEPSLKAPKADVHWVSVWSCTTEPFRNLRRFPPSACRTAGPSHAGISASAWAWSGPGPSPLHGLFYAPSTHWRSPASTGGPARTGYPEKNSRNILESALQVYRSPTHK